jgi:hypothetical protein
VFQARGQNSLKVYKGPEFFSGRVCSTGRNKLLAHVREQLCTYGIRPQHPDALVLHGVAYQHPHTFGLFLPVGPFWPVLFRQAKSPLFSRLTPTPPPHTLPLNCGPRIFLVGTVCSTGQSPLGCPCSAWRSLVAAVPFRPPLASRPLLAPVILPVVPTCGRALSASFSLLAPFGPCYSACWPSFSRLARFDPFWVSM